MLQYPFCSRYDSYSQKWGNWSSMNLSNLFQVMLLMKGQNEVETSQYLSSKIHGYILHRCPIRPSMPMSTAAILRWTTIKSHPENWEASSYLLSHLYSCLPPYFMLPSAVVVFLLSSTVQQNFLQCWRCSRSILSDVIATSHMWLLSTYNVPVWHRNWISKIMFYLFKFT